MGALRGTRVAWGKVGWAPSALCLHHTPWVEEIKLTAGFFLLVSDAEVKLFLE